MKLFLVSLSTVLIVFSSYLVFISHHFEIPFIWSMLLIYLYGKNHLNIAANSYFLFMLIVFADKINFEDMSRKTEFVYASTVIFVTFLFVLIYQYLAGKRFKVATVLSYTIAAALYVIPLFYIIYALNFDTKITEDVMFAIFQTNWSESLEFTKTFISPLWLITVLALAVLLGYLLLRQEKKETAHIEVSLLLFIIVFTFGTTKVLKHDIRLYYFAKDGIRNYAEELTLFKETQQKRKTGLIRFDAQKKEKGETYIVIIGESLNKRHMGVYGYFRDTTPHLSSLQHSNSLLLYTSAYANHTHTMEVLSLALTEANQYNGKNYFDSLSIINILNKADMETYWVSNQNMYGKWDNLVSILAHETDHLVSLNHTIGTDTKTQKYDAVVIDEVEKILKQPAKKNRVIFVHLMGSHVAYEKRYPKDEYTRFKGPLPQGIFGKSVQKDIHLNAYDNSVVYNDYVVSTILKKLKQEKGICALLYLSDHADDVMNGLGHNASKFTFEMVQIPMIIWLSEKYKKRYPDKFVSLSAHKKVLYSNDMLYDTLIGVFNIKTDRYSAQYDLTSEKYRLKDPEALTLHGRKKYTDKENCLYWQKKNTHFLLENNETSRIFPHRVDSIGKLKEIWQSGFRSFEVDVLFDSKHNLFQVGHNEGVMGVSLERFLSSVDAAAIQKVWLDFKNLDQHNLQKTISRLRYLDSKFHIKQKCIVESGTKGVFFKQLREEGWHTSYYLPTAKILSLLKEANDQKLYQLGTSIALQVKAQDVSAVSFDRALYPFVKKYLEMKLSENMVYHIWFTVSLENSSFQSELQRDPLYHIQRIKTLLTAYRSPYDL